MLPSSLIMRTCTCFYCDKPSHHDEQTLGFDFGIRYCMNHRSDALRDSRAYLHQRGFVRTQHALLDPILGPFLALLKSDTTIRRTSGILQGGWTLQHEPWSEYSTLKCIHEEWSIPMIHRSTEIMKYVSLFTFLEPAIIAANKEINPTIADQIQEIHMMLDHGIYKNEYDAFIQEPVHAPPQEVDGIISYGEVRIFVEPT